ncbi:MAG: hypothetical protein WD431_10080, partial [Cyclobacteriaceae bacterium]
DPKVPNPPAAGRRSRQKKPSTQTCRTLPRKIGTGSVFDRPSLFAFLNVNFRFSSNFFLDFVFYTTVLLTSSVELTFLKRRKRDDDVVMNNTLQTSCPNP